jgi:hypothetical protein
VEEMGNGGVKGERRDWLASYADKAGVHFDPARPLIPFSAFRDMTV